MDTPNLSPLKGFNSFRNVYEISERSHFGSILLFIVQKPANILIKGQNPNPDKIYLGISVQKKLFKKAVVRNRIKRLVRESVRRVILEFSKNYTVEKIQFILVSYKGEKIEKPKMLKLADIEKDFVPAFTKYCQKRLKSKEGSK